MGGSRDPIALLAAASREPEVQALTGSNEARLRRMLEDGNILNERNVKVQTETLKNQQESVSRRVRSTRSPATAYDIQEALGYQDGLTSVAREAFLRKQQEDRLKLTSFGKVEGPNGGQIDNPILTETFAKELALFEQGQAIERENLVKSLNQINIVTPGDLEIGANLPETLLTQMVRAFDEKNQKIAASSLGVDTDIAFNEGRRAANARPENQGKVTLTDSFALDEQARQLDLQKRGLEVDKLSQNLSANKKAQGYAETIILERTLDLEKNLLEARSASSNDRRRQLETQARQAETEVTAALAKKEELVQAERALNVELATQQANYEGITTAIDSQIPSVQELFNTWQRTTGIVNTTAVAIETGFLQAMDSASSGFSTLIENVVTGSATMGDAVRSFGQSVIQTMLQVAAKQAAGQLLGSIGAAVLGAAAGGSGQVYKNPIGPTQPFNGLRAASGGLITGPIANRDSVPSMLMPGEYVLNKNAVENIGKDTLHLLNSGVQRTQSTSSGFSNPAAGNSGSRLVNVYVVNKEGMPPVGPDDVIAVVGDNIARGGSLRKLIKSVALT